MTIASNTHPLTLSAIDRPCARPWLAMPRVTDRVTMVAMLAQTGINQKTAMARIRVTARSRGAIGRTASNSESVVFPATK